MKQKIRIEDVKEFFDSYAGSWDEHMKRNEAAIRRILDNARVKEGLSVLDVACGTGVLIPDYLSRGVLNVTAIDVSPEMIRIAKDKFSEENVKFVCEDVIKAETDRDYDVIMVYNAFPHFADPEELIRVLAGKLGKGGRLSIAHGMSREKIQAHHNGAAKNVSNGLMEAGELAKAFSKYLEVTCVISDEEMYQVVGEMKK